MISTPCAICKTHENAIVIYPESLPEKISANAFAPRREGDDFHYQMVRCKTCGLVRSDPIFEPEKLKQLYEDSPCTYSHENEEGPLNKTYGRYLEKMLRQFGVQRGAFLDIGCSNGFFLKKAKEMGFKKVVGVEPSIPAIDRADSEIKPHIIHGMFNGKTFEPEKFDVIVFFQTFDHIDTPNAFLQDCYRVLKPGGFILAINHNVGSMSARIMKEKSPIIDIGHAYLYDLKTMRTIFEKNKFRVHRSFPIFNFITLHYLTHLAPCPKKLKSGLKKILARTRLGRLTLPLPIGNLGIIAQKPK